MHEKTETIFRKGKWVNIITVGGKKGTQVGRSYNTVKEAVRAAKARSKSFDDLPRL